MTKTYKIEVDCANCAREMEEAAAKISGVQSVTVVEFRDGVYPDNVMIEVLKACKKVEPDCEIFL